MFLLDTNVISEMRKPKPHGAVLAWARRYTHTDYKTSSVTIYELQAGVEITRKQDTNKALELERWIGRMEATYQVLSFGFEAARETALMMSGTSPHMLQDAMIAAIAKVNGLIVATRNTKDFSGFGVQLTNPFLFKGD